MAPIKLNRNRSTCTRARKTERKHRSGKQLRSVHKQIFTRLICLSQKRTAYDLFLKTKAETETNWSQRSDVRFHEIKLSTNMDAASVYSQICRLHNYALWASASKIASRHGYCTCVTTETMCCLLRSTCMWNRESATSDSAQLCAGLSVGGDVTIWAKVVICLLALGRSSEIGGSR